MSNKFYLHRKRKGEIEWKRTCKGDLKFIIETLRLNLLTESLNEFEWKVGAVSE